MSAGVPMAGRRTLTSVIHAVFRQLFLFLSVCALGGCDAQTVSDGYQTDALAAEASILATSALTTPPTPRSPEAVAAASAFWGFYLWRTRATRQHCEALGVPLAAYADTFTRLHENEIAAASAIYAEIGLTREDSWKMLGEFLEGVTDQALRDRGEALTVSAAEVCQEIADSSSPAIAAIHFSKALPETHARLTASVDAAVRGTGGREP